MSATLRLNPKLTPPRLSPELTPLQYIEILLPAPQYPDPAADTIESHQISPMRFPSKLRTNMQVGKRDMS